MTARMTHPVELLPGLLPALLAAGKAAGHETLPVSTRELAELRASQLNGCGLCVDMHGRSMTKNGETPERIISVAAWRETPFYTDSERAALELAECMTRFSDRADQVPDEVFAEARKHFEEPALAALIASIALINVWNRLNGAIRQPAGQIPV